MGGLAVGEGFEMMCRVLDATTLFLPSDRPRYLMGVGKPVDLVEAVARGIDMFDCVLPTRSGRHGQAWSDNGPVNLKNARFAEDPARWTGRQTVRPAGTIRAPICITWSRRTSIWAPCSCPGTTRRISSR